MPLVVGQLLDEVLDLVSAAFGLPLAIAQPLGLRAEFAAMRALRLVHVAVSIRLMHGERFERLLRTEGGDISGVLGSAF